MKRKNKIAPRLNNFTGPVAPWSVRRVRLAGIIAARGNKLPVNVKYAYKTNTNEATAGDLRRLIKEGYAMLTLRPAGSSVGMKKFRNRKTVRHMELTAQGLALTLGVV